MHRRPAGGAGARSGKSGAAASASGHESPVLRRTPLKRRLMKGSGTGASGTGSPLRPVHFNTGKAGCPHDSPDSGVFHSRLRSGGPPGGARRAPCTLGSPQPQIIPWRQDDGIENGGSGPSRWIVRCDPVYCLESVSLSKTLFAGVLNSLPPMTGAPYFASIFANNDASSPAYLASKPPTLAALLGLWRRKYLRVFVASTARWRV